MKRLFITLTIFAFVVVPQFAFGSDVDDLKAANEKVIQAYNSLDAETIAAMQYPGNVSYGYLDAFPNVANTVADSLEKLKMLFSQVEFLQVIPHNNQYKVVGNTGIIWGHYSVNYKAKGEPLQTQHARITATWVKKDGKWYGIMVHHSAIPTGF